MQKKSHYTFLLVALPLLAAYAQTQPQTQPPKTKVVEFVGGARSLITNNEIGVQDSLPDTTTVKKNMGGYALIDLGVNIKPNKNVEILGMFRVLNNYGGFWGSGVTFSVRQLWLKGVLGDVLRYQIGDLNLKQTPFTLYNHNADRIDSLPTIFGLQQQIVQYERFYQKNTWRQQGVNIDFGLKFAKYIHELNVTAYTTRLQATDFAAIPDRLMSGVSLSLAQSKHLKVGFDGFYVYDLKGTTPDTSSYANTVQTINLAFAKRFKNVRVEVKGEAGKSDIYTTKNWEASHLNDYFIHAYGKIGLVNQHISLTGGYLEVGPDFRSIGAQSKNIDYLATPNFYNRYGNNRAVRPLSTLDLIRNENIYRANVTTNFAAINPVYNNVLPFGIATYNRVGFFGKLNYSLPKGIVIDLEHYRLSEIRGQGTFQLKQFTQSRAMAEFSLHQLFAIKPIIKIQLGGNYQTTQRSSSFEGENVNLTSWQAHAGFEAEVLPNIDLLGGAILNQTKGNDFIAERNLYSTVDNFSNQSYDLEQQLLAGGLRYRFSQKVYLSALYQASSYNSRLRTVPNYNINQFSLIYNMLF